MLLAPGNWLSSRKLAILFVRDMGNYGQHRVAPKTILAELRKNSVGVQFTACHWRPSGNFLFAHDTEETLVAARAIGEEVTNLPCLVRTSVEMEALVGALPKDCEETFQGSIVQDAPEGIRKVIWVGLSCSVPEDRRRIGAIGTRCSIHSWPTSRDVLCLYNRPKAGGDVGQVTTTVLRSIGVNADLFGTGRSMGLLRDLTRGKGIDDGPQCQ